MRSSLSEHIGLHAKSFDPKLHAAAATISLRSRLQDHDYIFAVLVLSVQAAIRLLLMAWLARNPRPR